ERDSRLLTDTVRAGEPEENVFAERAEVDGLQPELRCAVLLLGERLRVDDLDAQHAVRVQRKLLEHLPDAYRVRAQELHVRRLAVAEEQVQVDRLLQLAQQGAGAGRERVEPVLGVVEAAAPQQRVSRRDGGAADQRGERGRRITDWAGSV